jgi:hypothetical protein
MATLLLWDCKLKHGITIHRLATTAREPTYYATPGQNNGLGSSSYQGATWNFDFYFNATGGSYTYQLLFGTDALSLVSINPALVGDNGSTPNTGGQNSENLLFPAWGTLSSYQLNGLYSTFDPNANAVYSFELEALNSDGTVVATTAINVDVGTVPDAGSTVMLLGLGFAGLAIFGCSQNRLQVAK